MLAGCQCQPRHTLDSLVQSVQSTRTGILFCHWKKSNYEVPVVRCVLYVPYRTSTRTVPEPHYTNTAMISNSKKRSLYVEYEYVLLVLVVLVVLVP